MTNEPVHVPEQSPEVARLISGAFTTAMLFFAGVLTFAQFATL